MNKSTFLNQLQSVHANIFGLAYCLVGDREEAAQLTLDAVTVLAMTEKEFILDFDVEKSSKRKEFHRFLKKVLFRQIYELAQKRFADNALKPNYKPEFRDFFSLNLLKRSVLFLKEIQEFEISEIQEVFELQRHEVLELLYNARFELSKKEIPLPGDMTTSFNLFLAYTNKTLKRADHDAAERKVLRDKAFADFYHKKQNLMEFYKELIPVESLKKNQKVFLFMQVKDVIDTVFPIEKKNVITKVKNFLNKPILTINY